MKKVNHSKPVYFSVTGLGIHRATVIGLKAAMRDKGMKQGELIALQGGVEVLHPASGTTVYAE